MSYLFVVIGLFSCYFSATTQTTLKTSAAPTIATTIPPQLSTKDGTSLKTTPASQASTKDVQRALTDVDLDLIMNECNESFRTEMSYIDSLNRSGSFPDETEKTPKCFVRCMLERNNVVSEDGVFDQVQAQIFFAIQRPGTSVDDFRESTDACINRNETCICERSYRFVKCVAEMELNKKENM